MPDPTLAPDPSLAAARCLCRPVCALALRRLYEAPCDLDALAAVLSVRWAEACDAVGELRDVGLVAAGGGLTPAGLSYARGMGLLRRKGVPA